MSKKIEMDRKKSVEITTKKIEKNNVEGFQKLETTDLQLKSVKEKKEVEVKYACSLNQFAEFVESSQSVQTRIVNGQKYPPEKRTFWYQTSNAAIARSIKLNQSTDPLYAGIKKLEGTYPTGSQKQLNKANSIGAIQNYLKIHYPQGFRLLNKESFKSDNQPIDVFGVKVKVSPNVLFTSEVNGQQIIGAVKIHCAKGTPFNNTRMKVVAHLLKKFLDRIVENSEGLTVYNEHCLCVDVFGGNIVSAPKAPDAPSRKITRASTEYIDVWDNI